MDTKDSLIKSIVAAEWDMFQEVKTVDGQRASCQDSPGTFEIMRASQFVSWSEDALKSYIEDLGNAKQAGRNLLTEKYGRMMESTSPIEYAGIKDLLPPLDPEAPPLIDRIVRIIMEWEEELDTRHPHITKRGRALYSYNDNPLSTSKDTYSRGELATYSLKTLGLYYDYLMKLKLENINGSELILEEMVKRYGYTSIEQADEILKNS